MLEDLLDHETMGEKDASFRVVSPQTHVGLAGKTCGASVGTTNRRCNQVAGFHVCHAIADFLDDADCFVPQHELLRTGWRRAELRVDNLFVRSADTYFANPDENLIRPVCGDGHRMNVEDLRHTRKVREARLSGSARACHWRPLPRSLK